MGARSSGLVALACAIIWPATAGAGPGAAPFGPLNDAMAGRVRTVVQLQLADLLKGKPAGKAGVEKDAALSAVMNGRKFECKVSRPFDVTVRDVGGVTAENFYVVTTSVWEWSDGASLPAGTYLAGQGPRCFVQDPADLASLPASSQPDGGAGVATSRPAGPPGPGPTAAQKEAAAKVERFLLTVPDKNEKPWLKQWHGLLRMEASFTTEAGFGLDRMPRIGDLQALQIENASPCTLEIVSVRDSGSLRVDGDKDKGGRVVGLTVAPGKKLLLAAKPGLGRMALDGDFAGKKMMAYTVGTLCRIKVAPNQPGLEPLEFDIEFEIGQGEKKVVAAGYLLSTGSVKESRKGGGKVEPKGGGRLFD